MIVSQDFVNFIGFCMHDRQQPAVLFHHIFGRPGAQTMLFAPYDPTYLPFIPILLDIRQFKALIDRDRAIAKGRYCFLPWFRHPRGEKNGCRLPPRLLSYESGSASLYFFDSAGYSHLGAGPGHRDGKMFISRKCGNILA